MKDMFSTSSKQIILASKSKARQKLLISAGIKCLCLPASINEDSYHETLTEPLERATTLAKAKALAVSKLNTSALVIGADQVCALDDHIFSKPKTKANATAQLLKLQGKTHQLHSAVCFVKNQQVVWEECQTINLSMRALTHQEIKNYVNQDKPLDCCGSYRYEEQGKHLFDAVDAESDAIQGLPLKKLRTYLFQQEA